MQVHVQPTNTPRNVPFDSVRAMFPVRLTLALTRSTLSGRIQRWSQRIEHCSCVQFNLDRVLRLRRL